MTANADDVYVIILYWWFLTVSLQNWTVHLFLFLFNFQINNDNVYALTVGFYCSDNVFNVVLLFSPLTTPS